MSKLNAETKSLVLYAGVLQDWISQSVEDLMDQQVVKTDMKLRHIVNKAAEVKKITIFRELDFIFCRLNLFLHCFIRPAISGWTRSQLMFPMLRL